MGFPPCGEGLWERCPWGEGRGGNREVGGFEGFGVDFELALAFGSGGWRHSDRDSWE